MKKLVLLLLSISLWVHSALAQNSLQITTHFKEVVGKPSWLVIIRDLDNDDVIPYLFDIRERDNFWMAFTPGHKYQITVSNLKFGEYAVINDFCGLQKKGVITDKSFYITLGGKLTPRRASSTCHVQSYATA